MRVCPSNKVHLAGLTQKVSWMEQSALGRAFMFLAYTYTTHSEIILEGENLSVFGLLNYNLSADEFTIDNPIGFIQNGKKEELLGKLSDEANSKLFQCLKSAALGAAFIAGAVYLGKQAY